MAAKAIFFLMTLALVAGTATAQQTPAVPDASSIYCSGVVTTERVPQDTYLITGEQSASETVFSSPDVVYINKGASQGVKVGDEFLVSRPVQEPLEFPWFTWQPRLVRAMGTMYQDLGRLRVVHVDAKVATAEILSSCDYMQRGDIVQQAVDRPAPPLKESSKFDPYAAPSGKAAAMVVETRNFRQAIGKADVVYVNLGSKQGVKVGDYFRIFRYQGSRGETIYQTPGTAYQMYGFGSAPARYKWNDLPREVLGEGIVLRTGPNAATVLVTVSLREIYVGDYVEIE